MDPDRSSRGAARRIVEEVLADHAARATPLDGAKPVTIVERPDTPSWRAARRIVEETLAEHAARAVIPSAMRVEVVVDLEERDVEVVLDLDEHASATETPPGAVASAQPSEPAVVDVVAPIERDETPAKGARRVVEGVLAEQEIDPDAPTDADDPPMAFEIDPVPGALEERPEPVTTGADTADVPAADVPAADVPAADVPAADVPAAVEPSGTDDAGDPDHQDSSGPTGAGVVEGSGDGPIQAHEGPVAGEVDVEVVPVDDERLRAAIPEWLFAPEPEPESRSELVPESTDESTTIDEPSAEAEQGAAPSVDGQPATRTPEALPPTRLDPDAPVAIAARIVAGVLADRERAAEEALEAQEAQEAQVAQDAMEAQEAQAAQDAMEAQEARDAVAPELVALEADLAGSEPSGDVPGTEPGTGPVAPEGPEPQPSGVPEGWAVMPSASERGAPGAPSGVMTVDAGVEDPVLDPVASDPRVDDLQASESDEFWREQEAAAPGTDEFGAWPDPIAPPRRTGRWLITTVLGALLLAVLLPLAIGALRDLVSFS